MNKKIMVAVCAVAASVALAKEQEQNGVKNNASNPAVQEILAQPDGVSLIRSESDGSLQLFARGTADYSFGDARDIRDTTKVAEIKAKAALSKYLTEVAQSEESETEGSMCISRTLLTETPDGSLMKKDVSRDVSRKIQETISVRSAAILSGVVALKIVKIPTEGSKTSGEIQVTLGISTKTLAAAAEAHNMITDSINARRKIGEQTNAPMPSAPGTKIERLGEATNQNKPEVRVNDTLF